MTTPYPLLESVANGRRTTLGTVFGLYSGVVYHLVTKRGFQDADARDITQVFFQKLPRKLQSYKPQKGKFRSWLRTAVRNEAEDYRRSEAKHSVSMEPTRIDEHCAPEVVDEGVETSLLLTNAMKLFKDVLTSKELS